MNEWIGDSIKEVNYLFESSKVLQSFDNELSYEIVDLLNYISKQILNKQVFSNENLEAIILDIKDIAKSNGLALETEKAFISYIESASGLKQF